MVSPNLMTEKSVTDHGLSVVAQQDCALWRLVTEGEVCRDEDDAITAIASADLSLAVDPSLSTSYANGIAPVSWDDTATVEELSFMEVAIVELDVPTVMIPTDEVAIVSSTVAALPPRKPGIAIAVTPVLSSVDVSSQFMTSAGDYFVIGSFSMQNNAKGFARSNGDLDTKVLPAVVSGNQVYRVVVGPVGVTERDAITLSLREAGHTETWPLRVSEALTTVAWRTVHEEQLQVASLPDVFE